MSERLKEIRERVENATPGLWEKGPTSWKVCRTVAGSPIQEPLTLATATYNGDAEFIAHAREDIPYLLAELERVTEERDTARIVARANKYSCARLREALAHAKKVIDYHAACAPEHLKEISRIEAGGDGKE